MTLIVETKNFILESHDKPEVDRLDGGHIKISPKVHILDRQQLSPDQAKEFVRLSILAGEAMKRAYAKIGITLGRINYQDNGNWNPSFHLHLYGRATNAKYQKYGDPIISGNKPEYSPLSESDIIALQTELRSLLLESPYKDSDWGFELT